MAVKRNKWDCFYRKKLKLPRMWIRILFGWATLSLIQSKNMAIDGFLHCRLLHSSLFIETCNSSPCFCDTYYCCWDISTIILSLTAWGSIPLGKLENLQTSQHYLATGFNFWLTALFHPWKILFFLMYSTYYRLLIPPKSFLFQENNNGRVVRITVSILRDNSA